MARRPHHTRRNAFEHQEAKRTKRRNRKAGVDRQGGKRGCGNAGDATCVKEAPPVVQLRRNHIHARIDARAPEAHARPYNACRPLRLRCSSARTVGCASGCPPAAFNRLECRTSFDCHIMQPLRERGYLRLRVGGSNLQSCIIPIPVRAPYTPVLGSCSSDLAERVVPCLACPLVQKDTRIKIQVTRLENEIL